MYLFNLKNFGMATLSLPLKTPLDDMTSLISNHVIFNKCVSQCVLSMSFIIFYIHSYHII